MHQPFEPFEPQSISRTCMRSQTDRSIRQLCNVLKSCTAQTCLSQFGCRSILLSVNSQPFSQNTEMRKGVEHNLENVTIYLLIVKSCPMFLEKWRQSASSVIFWRMQCSWHMLEWSWTLEVNSWPHSTAFLSQTRQRLCRFCLEPAELPWTQETWGEGRRNI